MTTSDDEETTPIERAEGRPLANPETLSAPPYADSDATILSGPTAPERQEEVRYLGRYRLISEIGRGGQSAVYLAEDQSIRRRVALKVLLGGGIFSFEARLRFQREAEATGRLNHSGIAKILEFGESGGIPFIAMEFIEGQALNARLGKAREAPQSDSVTEVHFDFEDPESRPPSKPRSRLSSSSSSTAASSTGQKDLLGTAQFMESTARALHVAHEAGLVHRDIKPGNIMVRLDETPCILDFGLARDESAQAVDLTQHSKPFGTPAYMAPEQVRGLNRQVDRRTDVWALGATLYECCTLERPFQAPRVGELYDRIKNEEPRAPRLLNPKIPRDLQAIILTALDKDPDRRYATALDFAEDLRRFRSYEPVRARPAGRLLKSYRWVQRNKAITGSGTIVMLTFLIAAIVFFLKSNETRKARDQAQEALIRADEQAKVSREESKAKGIALDNYDRLADVKRLESAIATSSALFPPSPALVSKLENWQEEHGSLAGKIEGHKRFLVELRTKARAYTDRERKTDFSVELTEIRNAKATLAEIERALAGAGADETKTNPLLEQQAAVTKRLAALESLTTTGRRSWRFADQAQQFQHDVLDELVADLESFANAESGPVKSVAARLEQSRDIAKETLEGNEAARWLACSGRIAANPQYAGFDLAPQLGLIPLGPDPDSGLEEFLHWLTHAGELPERDKKTKKIAVTENLGVVLVLIPGGSFLMGSQENDRSKPNFDPGSKPDEQPVNEVSLQPYLLSKYEMTQAQWQRAFQASPSQYGPSFGSADSRFKAPVDARHPVERISWDEAQLLLPQINLMLPTSAEWERAARAGRSDLVYAGSSEIASLRDFANISGSETAGIGWPVQAGHEDDYIVHAPVGSLLPNAYGLHDMIGNVWEWCLDGSADSYTETPGPRGLRDDPNYSVNRVYRGGSFQSVDATVRVAFRNLSPPGGRAGALGLRPSMKIS